MLDLIKDNIVLGLVLINLFRFNLFCIEFSRAFNPLAVYATRMAQSNSRGNINFNLVFVIMAGAMVAR